MPMLRAPTLQLTAVLSVALSATASAADRYAPRTRVSLAGGFWEINGKVTYEGMPAEGLLLNVRMVNSTFDDRNPKTCPKGFDPDRNTAAFLAKLPEYAAHGVRAITLNLQGGMPGYEGALNSVFAEDGSLRKEGLKRVQDVIEACDRLGVVVILGYFYQRQDQVLRDEAAVRRGVVEATSWVRDRGYTNVLVEIANEHDHDGFDHKVIRDPAGCASLIELAKKTGPALLVSASSLGDGRVANQVGDASDFLLAHFNSVPVDRIQQMVFKLAKRSKAIVCNEDDKTGEEAVAAMEASVRALCSWGYMNKEKNQYSPFTFEGGADDPPLYRRMRELAIPAAEGKKSASP